MSDYEKPTYEEVMIHEAGSDESAGRRFWLCSQCSGLIAGKNPTADKQRHDTFHARR